MPKYRVQVERSVFETATVVVEADNEYEAEERAAGMAEGLTYTLDHSYNSGAFVVGEVEDDEA